MFLDKTQLIIIGLALLYIFYKTDKTLKNLEDRIYNLENPSEEDFEY